MDKNNSTVDEYLYARSFNYGYRIGMTMTDRDKALVNKFKEMCLFPENEELLSGIAHGLEHCFRVKTEELRKTRLAELQKLREEKEKKVKKDKGLEK